MSIPITATSEREDNNPFLIGVAIDPVEIIHTRICQYKAKPCKNCGRAPSNPAHNKKNGACQLKRSNGCVNCGKAKNHADHYGAPQSLNILGSGNQGLYTELNHRWQKILSECLEASGLPRGLRSVMVECTITFPDLGDRDEGNISFIIEKALGDALVSGWGYSTGKKSDSTYEWHQVIDGGWLEKDTFFPVRRYSFGNIVGVHEPGVSSVRLTLFPG